MTNVDTSVNTHVTGRRIVATLIDGVVLGIVYSVFRALFGTAKPATGGYTGFGFTRLSTGGGVGWLVVVVLYYVILEGYFGRTVGKLVTGIRVISESTGRPPGYGRALLRTVLRLIDGIASYLVGFIIVVNSKRNRRLGDIAADTLVVRA
jgi:uncharacterized RDD family membrane protein YckC